MKPHSREIKGFEPLYPATAMSVLWPQAKFALISPQRVLDGLDDFRILRFRFRAESVDYIALAVD